MAILPHVCISCARRSFSTLSQARSTKPSYSPIKHLPRSPNTLIATSDPPSSFPHPSHLHTRAGSPPDPAPPAKTSSDGAHSYLQIPPSALALRWETTVPSTSQLAHADAFFRARPARFIASAPHFRDMRTQGTAPEVAFLGRSNVGKSSLLNALLGTRICHTSKKPGRTRAMNAISVRDGRLVVLDMPGYGRGSHAEWGAEVLKYLAGRRQLRRALVLVDAAHGVKASDSQLLGLLRAHAVPHQLVLAKADRLLFPTARTPSPAAVTAGLAELRAALERVREAAQPGHERGPPALGEILACSSAKARRGGLLGVSGLRFAVLRATGLEGDVSGRKRTNDGIEVTAGERIEDEGHDHDGAEPWGQTS